MHAGIISLFPEMFTALNASITGRALKDNKLKLSYWNPRDFANDRHHTVDDKPYGGGPGMLMKVEPLQKALQAAKQQHLSARTIYLSPQGKPFTQAAAKSLAQQSELIFLCGRYEGIDERLIESEVDEEWSIGDYVVTGGELPAMIMIDAIARLLPGVLGDELSAEQDSFSQGLLDCPHYTRPEIINNQRVPEILLSGNHAAIATWREHQALLRTYQRRPELLAQLNLTEEQLQWLSSHQTKQPDSNQSQETE